MNKHILIHYDELGLKGKNRPFFERKLKENIVRQVKKHIGIKMKVNKEFGRFRVPCTEIIEENIDEIVAILKKTFGIAWFAVVTSVDNDMEAIKAEAVRQFQPHKNTKGFRITTRRSHKYFEKTSMEISAQVGEEIFNTYNAPVDLHTPETTVYLEVTQEATHIFTDRIEGARGLPVGSSGRAIIMLSGGIDSPVAAWYAMKRGLQPVYVHFHSAPYTSEASQEKVAELKKVLDSFTPGALHVIPFADIQKYIVFNAPEALRVILYRVYMLKIAEHIAARENAQTIITGESLGQVASQTIQNIAVTNSSVELPILRPLIGFDKKEIIARAKTIGTFDISIQPHDDCCTVFLPDKPATRSSKTDVAQWIHNPDLARLMDDATKTPS